MKQLVEEAHTQQNNVLLSGRKIVAFWIGNLNYYHYNTIKFLRA